MHPKRSHNFWIAGGIGTYAIAEPTTSCVSNLMPKVYWMHSGEMQSRQKSIEKVLKKLPISVNLPFITTSISLF